ncbi:MAG TPA: hypothetical protein VK151_00910 [Fluviicola sp.]|nr:hypothetical protein [Fluviicola sp.]
MKKWYLLALIVGSFLSAVAQQTADELIADVIALTPRPLVKYDTKPRNNVFLLRTGFNDAVYQDKASLSALKGKVIIKVELIYTTYRKSETFDQHGLNRKRLRALFAAAPQLLTQPSVEWVLMAQTGCTSSEEGKDYFHGVAITYREPASAALRDTELEFLKGVADGTVPTSAYETYLKNELKGDTSGTAASAEPPKITMPGFPGGERARIDFFANNIKFPSTSEKSEAEQVVVQFVIDKAGNIQHISLPGAGSPTPYHEEMLRFMRSMPKWSPGSVNGKKVDCMVMFTVDFMERGSIVPSPLEVYAMDSETAPSVPKFDYSRIKPTPQGKFVSTTLANNNWKQSILVCDVTASMAPYSAQVLEFIKGQFAKKDTSMTHFVFFNDGNDRKDNAKKVGSVGGIYIARAVTLDEALNNMSEAMKAGTGGDLEENNIEALLKAEAACPTCQSTVLIADNMASPRDMVLVPQLTKPVHVIVCGTSPILNEDYMNLARATKGTLHFNNKDYSNLHMFEEGATFQVGKETFVVKKGQFVRREN